jgi:hypothetical protein
MPLTEQQWRLPPQTSQLLPVGAANVVQTQKVSINNQTFVEWFVDEYFGGTLRAFRQIFTREDAIEFHAFVRLEALPSMWPIAFILCIHFLTGSYRKYCPKGLLGLVTTTSSASTLTMIGVI